MIEKVIIRPGYAKLTANTQDAIGIPKLKEFDGEAREAMYSEVQCALKENGLLFVAADLEWNAEEIIAEAVSYGLKYMGPFVHKQIFSVESEYKAQCHAFIKPASRSARDYTAHLVDVGPDDKVLEIGPGNYPLKRANVYLDSPRRKTQTCYTDTVLPVDKPVVWADIQERTKFGDKEFDFVYCSHVLEHVPDPLAAAAEISRIGKRGLVVMPSYAKEAFFMWEEEDHKWDVLPPSAPGRPIPFVRPDFAWRQELATAAVRASMCRIMRTGPFRTNDYRVLAAWFRECEPLLDVIVPWEGELKIQVVE